MPSIYPLYYIRFIKIRMMSNSLRVIPSTALLVDLWIHTGQKAKYGDKVDGIRHGK